MLPPFRSRGFAFWPLMMDLGVSVGDVAGISCCLDIAFQICDFKIEEDC